MSANAVKSARRDASAADGSTFAPGLALLPPALKVRIERFYRVLRTIDDLVDEDDPRAAQRVAALERWARGQAASSPETRTLTQLEERRPLPRRWLLHFCAGMRHDLARAEVQTDLDLDRYCHQAGGSVGIVLAHLLDAEGIAEPQDGLSEAEAGMERLGRAMQITNIARDIDEDLAHQRLYIPTSLIERHGFPAPGAREGLLRELIARADALYEQGQRAIRLLRDGQRAMALAATLYREILRQIEREGFGQREGRAVVPAWRTQELIAEHQRLM
jgi:phytoene synthase